MENDKEILIAVVGLWIPITITLVNIALKFGRLVNSVEQMQQKLAVLDDVIIRLTKLEVIVDGQTKES